MRGQESSYITLHALLRAPRFLSREILTLPRRRLSASLLHHGPPPATPRPMTYHPRDNATAHGPRPTRQRPTASDDTTPRQRPTASDAAPTTQPGQRYRAPEPSSRRPIRQRRHPRTQRRSTARGHHQRDNAVTPTDAAAPHDVTRAPEQSIRAPHSYPAVHQRSHNGARSKAPSRPHHTVTASRHHGITPYHRNGDTAYLRSTHLRQQTHEQHVRQARHPTRWLPRGRGCLTALPPSQRTNPHLTRRSSNSQFLNLH